MRGGFINLAWRRFTQFSGLITLTVLALAFWASSSYSTLAKTVLSYHLISTPTVGNHLYLMTLDKIPIPNPKKQKTATDYELAQMKDHNYV